MVFPRFEITRGQQNKTTTNTDNPSINNAWGSTGHWWRKELKSSSANKDFRQQVHWREENP